MVTFLFFVWDFFAFCFLCVFVFVFFLFGVLELDFVRASMGRGATPLGLRLGGDAPNPLWSAA